MTDCINRKNAITYLCFILGFALLFRLTVGVGYVSTMDVYWYRGWALDLPNGLFDVYARADLINLDYPPLYLLFLYPIGLIYKAIGGADAHVFVQMLLMKFWPIVFDVLCSLLLYLCCSKYGRHVGLFAAGIWALNPSTFLNSTMWGQTDEMMAFTLILSFWLLHERHPIAACVAFAFSGLLKYQSLLFTPIFLLELFFKFGTRDIKVFLKGIGAAAITVAAVFLPFMIGSQNPKLFTQVYFGGAGRYPYCTLNAFNLYGIMQRNFYNGHEDTVEFFGGISYATFGYIMLGIIVAAIIALYIFEYKKKRETCSFLNCFILMQWVFIFMTRMHERYQIIVLPFILLAYIVHRRASFLYLFGALTVMTLINQAYVLFYIKDRNIFYADFYDKGMAVLSVVNYIIFIWSIIEVLRFYFKSNRPENKNETSPTAERRPI